MKEPEILKDKLKKINIEYMDKKIKLFYYIYEFNEKQKEITMYPFSRTCITYYELKLNHQKAVLLFSIEINNSKFFSINTFNKNIKFRTK